MIQMEFNGLDLFGLILGVIGVASYLGLMLDCARPNDDKSQYDSQYRKEK